MEGLTIILLSYDISDDKKRTRFAKYISKFGHRIQYSVFEIENSPRIINNILTDIENKFSKQFDQRDSIYIFKLNPNCEVIKYGYASNDGSLMFVK